VAQNLSDINGMGGRATALTVALAVPPDVAVEWILELAQGMQEEAAVVGASIVGGDISRGDAITVAVNVMGHCDGAPVLRSGARPGDMVAVAGRLGWSAAGFAALSRGFRSPRVVVEAHRRPEPPYEAGPEAKQLGATALVDVSDGLLADLGHVADASGVLVDVDPSVFEIPEPLQAVGAAVGKDPIAFVLTGGEDHALAATFPPGIALPPAWKVVGEVREGQGVLVGGEPYEGPEGWDHFRR
jgi:thiamine-monophosphate kinase